MIAGIYQIINQINKKSYIGSSIDITKRWKRHKYDLKRGNHHSIPLQRAFIKYGDDNLKFKMLEELTNPNPQELLFKEQQWIDKLKPEYNIGSVCGGDNISNHPNHDAICKRKAEIARENWKNPAYRTKQLERLKGDGNPNWKGGISSPICSCGKKIHYGKKHCPRCSKLGQRNPFYGKHHSHQTKEWLRKERLGKKPLNQRKVSVEGILYPSATEAGRQIGVCTATILFRIKSKYWDYKYI